MMHKRITINVKCIIKCTLNQFKSLFYVYLSGKYNTTMHAYGCSITIPLYIDLPHNRTTKQ